MDEPSTNPSNYSMDTSTSPAPLVPEQKPAPRLHSIFMGPNGLRAGWSFAIYLAAFFALLTAISFAIRPLLHLHPHETPPVWVFLVGEVESLIAAVLPAFAMARYERRPFGAYGLPLRGGFGKQFWVGVAWGI